MEPRTHYAKAGSFNIAYQVVGDGPIDIVLSPGAVTHLELSWEVPPLARFLGRLASFSRLILFDKRGTGLSDRVAPDALPTLEQRMEDLGAVMDAARSERAALFGTLGGAAMSGLFASTFPDRALALILYGTFGKMEPDTGLLSRIADTEEVALDRIEREWGTEAVTVAFWAPSLVTDEEVKESFLRLARSAVSPGAARTLFQLGFRIDWESVLPSIRVPTLVMHRTGDQVAPVRQGRKLAEGIPRARFVELDGVDHFMWVGDQESILREVEAFLAELQPAIAPTRVLATILMTDIVGSTETVARVGDARWKELVEKHRELVRRELRRFGGNEVDTAGDGFLATFDGPARAVECAAHVIEETNALGLSLRCGLHTGECEQATDGIRGIAVHVAARVNAMAGSDEILVTGTVKDLAAGSGIDFDDRGEHSLKGVPGTWRLYSAGVPGVGSPSG